MEYYRMFCGFFKNKINDMELVVIWKWIMIFYLCIFINDECLGGFVYVSGNSSL